MNNLTISFINDSLKQQGVIFVFTGNVDTIIDHVTPINEVDNGALTFFRGDDFEKYKESVNGMNAFVLKSSINMKALPVGNFFFFNNPEIGFYLIARMLKISQVVEINPNAVISGLAKIGKNVSIGAFSYIGSNVVISDNVKIDQNCVIDNAIIGTGSCIQSGVKIGSDALGPLKDDFGKWHDRPHFGKVIIGAETRIEDNTVINRGYLGDTFIGNNVRIGPQCCIGNGVKIAENCLIAQSVTIAGSVRVERNVSIWGNSSIREGITINEYAVVGMGAVVLRNIPEKELWVGNPARYKRLSPI